METALGALLLLLASLTCLTIGVGARDAVLEEEEEDGTPLLLLFFTLVLLVLLLLLLGLYDDAGFPVEVPFTLVA